MKVLLVDNLLIRQEESGYSYDLQPHLGLLSLLGAARSEGHEVGLYDPKIGLHDGRLQFDETLYRHVAEDLLNHNADVLGFTSLGCNFICTLKIASHVKAAAPQLQILLGGPHATILDETILATCPEFDIVFRNEAEASFPRLLDSAGSRDLSRIPGITWRDGSRIVRNAGSSLVEDLDTLPWPEYEAYPIRQLGLRTLRVEAGRGCPFSCTFCSTATFFGRKYRLKSAGRLCRELDFLNAGYGITHFALMHDLFTVNRSKVVEFCDAVAGRGYTWTCSARMDCVDPELLQHMFACGCRSIYYGVETGSARMQKISEKRQDLGIFDAVLDATERAGMEATVSFIAGYPQEQLPDLNATLDLVGKCFSRSPLRTHVQLHLLTPEPGTGLLAEFGLTLAFDGHISDFNFPTLEPDDSAIMARNPKLFPNHHFYPSGVDRARLIFTSWAFETLHRFGFTLAAHLSAHYGGLADFLDQIWKWSSEKPFADAASTQTIEAFVRHTRGEHHYLAALVRYASCATELRTQPSPDCGWATSTTGLVMGRHAAVLLDIQDCPAILSFLDADATVTERDIPVRIRRRRSNFLVVADAGNAGTFRNFEIDATVAELLMYLRVARTEQQCSHQLRGVPRSTLRNLLKELIDIGCLHECAAA